jgi:CheY-like chemotaxis protein
MAGWSTRDRASRIHAPERRVLVVDDDEAIREVARAALELVGGWQVTTVGSGQDAHAVASALIPDAVLLDVMMPGRDGPATVASMRADPATRDIPVIFLTAKAPPEGARAWQGIGLAGVIRKPFDPMTLAADIAGLLGWEE